MAVNPDSSAVAPCPMSRPPDVIGAAHVIPRTTRIVRPITNLDRDGTWVRGIPRITWPVRATIIRPAIVPWVITIVASTSACTDCDKNKNEQERRPVRSHSRSIPGGDRIHLRLINNVHFHIIHIYGLDGALTRLNPKTSAGRWRTVSQFAG